MPDEMFSPNETNFSFAKYRQEISIHIRPLLSMFRFFAVRTGKK